MRLRKSVTRARLLTYLKSFNATQPKNRGNLPASPRLRLTPSGQTQRQQGLALVAPEPFGQYPTATGQQPNQRHPKRNLKPAYKGEKTRRAVKRRDAPWNGSGQISRQPMRASAKTKGSSIARIGFLPIVEVLIPRTLQKRLKSLPRASAFCLTL